MVRWWVLVHGGLKCGQRIGNATTGSQRLCFLLSIAFALVVLRYL